AARFDAGEDAVRAGCPASAGLTTRGRAGAEPEGEAISSPGAAAGRTRRADSAHARIPVVTWDARIRSIRGRTRRCNLRLRERTPPRKARIAARIVARCERGV